MEIASTKIDLRVFITYFVPPEQKMTGLFRSYLYPRMSWQYLRSWLRLIRHGTRGHQPWKKDVMTIARKRNQKSKFRHLCHQILLLQQMKLKSLEIYIHTNSLSDSQKLQEIFPEGHVRVLVFPKYSTMNHLNNSSWNLADPNSPWYLTWEHKATMKKVFQESKRNAFFLCLEDDTLFTASNLEYFLKFHKSLKKKSLLPSFLQVEFADSLKQYFAVGFLQNAKVKIETLPLVKINDQLFAQLPNPYSGIILLDYEQTQQYVNSDAFSEKASRSLTWWGIGERAAMGLQFINPPNGFLSRNVVPLNFSRTGVKKEAWVIHQPNIYVEKRELVSGLTPDSLIEN